MPTVSPPPSFAPRQAASITPPRPPVTTIAPSSASRRPAAYACSRSSCAGADAPITATYSAKLGPEALAQARVAQLPAELLLRLCVRHGLQPGREAGHAPRCETRDPGRDAPRLLGADQFGDEGYVVPRRRRFVVDDVVDPGCAALECGDGGCRRIFDVH